MTKSTRYCDICKNRVKENIEMFLIKSSGGVSNRDCRKTFFEYEEICSSCYESIKIKILSIKEDIDNTYNLSGKKVEK